MGNLASKVKGDSPPLSSHPWFSAPCGSWVIRFSPGISTQNFDEMTEIKGLPLYHWSSPDWITGDIFNNLMFVVVQIFLEGNPNRLIRLIEEPLEAAEMIAQFNTFVDSTNQDVRELRNQLFEAAHESIHLHVEEEQLRYLDLLVTNEFDPGYEVRAVISRKNRSSKSSLLCSVSSAIKTKLDCFKKNKGRPIQRPFRVPSNTPLRPTAPWLSEMNERTETITSKDDLDNTDEICITAVFDNSNIHNSTKDGDRERVKTESKNAKSTRNLEEDNAELELEMPSISFSLPSTAETPLPTSEQSLDELITNQKDLCCSEVSHEASTDTYSSLTDVTENAVLLQLKENKENTDKEKNAGEGSYVQDSGEHADVHGQVSHSEVIIHTHPAEAGEQHNSNCGPVHVCGDVPSGPKQAVLNEYSKDNGLLCGNVPSGPKEVGSNEHRKDNGPTCYDVPSGPKHAKEVEHSEDDGPVCVNVPSGPNQDKSSEHSLDHGPVCADSPPGTSYAESNEDKDNNNGPVFNDCIPGDSRILADSTQHHKNDDPVSVMAPPEKHPSNPSAFLPIHVLSKSCLRCKTQPVNTDAQERFANVKEEKDQSAKPQIHKPSSSSLVCLPFHGLSRGAFSPPRQGESTGVQSRKRKADINEDDGELAAKRLIQDDTFGEGEENRDPSGPRQAESSEHRKYNGPSNSNVPSCPKHADSSEHSHDHGPDSSPKLNEDKDNDNGPVLNDFPPGVIIADSTQHHKNDDPVSVMAPPEKHPSNPSTFLPIYGLSKSFLRSKTQPVNTDAQESCANVKEEKEQSSKPQIHKVSSSSFVCLPFHGLSRGSFSPPRQGESTGVQSRKRKADIDESNGGELAAKRLKQENTFRKDNRDPCNSSAEGADRQSDTKMKPRCDDVVDTESDDGNDDSSSESVEWHDALGDTEP